MLIGTCICQQLFEVLLLKFYLLEEMSHLTSVFSSAYLHVWNALTTVLVGVGWGRCERGASLVSLLCLRDDSEVAFYTMEIVMNHKSCYIQSNDYYFNMKAGKFTNTSLEQR